MRKSELKLAIRFKEIAYNIPLAIGSVLLSCIASIVSDARKIEHNHSTSSTEISSFVCL